MVAKQPLARRIVLAFTLLTAVVSALFAWGILAVVHLVEDDLVGDELQREMAAVREVYRLEGRVPDLVAGSELYVPDLHHKPLPPELAGYGPGYHEVVGEAGAWYTYKTTIDGHDFILVRNQDDFEAREQLLLRVVLIGFFAALGLALLIGNLTARRVIDPVVRLANQVRNRDQLLPLAPSLASDYAADELGQLALAFDHALDQLRAAVNRERLFTSDVSHELRTPLMIIATSAELLARADLPPREQRQVERIGKAAAEMRALVETFLQLARAQSVGNAVEAGVLLADMAAEQAAYWGEEIRNRGLAFSLQVAAESSVRYHPTFLRVVMGNLLRNALHYTEQGEIRLILEAQGFRVEDSGPGIPEVEKETLFQPFVRGRQARGEGLGLGLSLVKRVCEQQGWSIAVGNRASGGTCFSVILGR
ncbi:HAMP domain-containing sensor histidine kinase [Azonexus sp.]|uniref:sensor histidine kinase n=1 Tax=Azonexus sp. TaxID=1872668 RepID=UPI0027B92C60|nr:HAMP domain-containing sensor histidine kinase [Azonexus sp.]